MRIDYLPASRFKGRPVPDYCFVVPDVFIPHLFNHNPVQIWYGSRFSAKSATKARELLGRCAGKDYFRGIYARQNQVDVKNSQYQLFKDIINARPWLSNQFVCRDSDYTIINTITGNMLLAGSFDNPQKIMSIADPTDIWVEEPITKYGEISQQAFISMFGSLRNQYEIPPRFHFTFNPISIESWIYELFFDKKTIPCNAVLANYGDNPFCPSHAFKFFDWLLTVDPDQHEIDALGKWGVPKPENPYFHRLLANPGKYFGKVEYKPGLPVYLIHDFNVVNSVLIMQKQNGAPVFLDEYHIDGLDLEALCKELCMKYGKNFLLFTGDASGNNASAYTKGNQSAWNLIRGYMMKYGAKMTNYDAVPKFNPGTDTSCFISNALISHYLGKMRIDPDKCPITTSDIKKMRRLSDGTLDKKHADKNGYGHLGDCFRYSLCNFEYTTYKQIIQNHNVNP
ncbi:phage terminase large subunit [Spirosoma sp.]|uniref:phage terminase large subunit n=1 Tax=Spirosoma sp. TaxID=1899569 RepID=UPI002627A975|nr:phage terminase large subunit [Spirosoma sp.]MCX6217641.1 phage terminase large subunit [Spirosoma sp.]